MGEAIMFREEFQKAYGRVVARAWSDEAFKERVVFDPLTVFRENGIPVPEGVHVKVIENTEKSVHFILPPKPEKGCGESACSVAECCTCFMFHIWKMWF